MSKSVRLITAFLILVAFLVDGCGLFKSVDTENPSNKSRPRPLVNNTKYDSRVVKSVITTALDFTGTPYKFGGTNRNGMDCSGLVTVAFSSADLKLPRVSADMANVGKEVSIKDLRLGDLVFFITGKENRISHVGIVTNIRAKDDILFIHASDSGVREDNLFGKYYQRTFVKATRPF